MSKFIDGKNYFNEISLNEICEALESGEKVQVGIDCIGHTRNNNEQEAYKESLLKKYGERLVCSCVQGAYSYSYIYQLVGGKND